VTVSVTRTEPINVAVQGEGHPVLVLHGLGGDSKQSLGLLPGGSPVTLIAPELPGHGDTDLLPDEPASFEAFAALCASVLDGMRVAKRISSEPVPVVGVSMGAGVALALVAARPDLVTGLEQEFNVKIPDADLVPERFDTVTKIEAYLDGRKD